MEPVLLPTIPVIARTGGFADAPVAGIIATQVAAASMTGIKKSRRTRNHLPNPPETMLNPRERLRISVNSAHCVSKGEACRRRVSGFSALTSKAVAEALPDCLVLLGA
jgi:hypothetical protein